MSKTKEQQTAQHMAWEKIVARRERLADEAIAAAPKYEAVKLKAEGCTTSELAKALSQHFQNVTFSASFEDGNGNVTAVPRRDRYFMSTSHTEESLDKIEAALKEGGGAVAALSPGLVYPTQAEFEAFAKGFGTAYVSGREEGRKEGAARRDRDGEFPGFHPVMFHPMYGRRGSW